MTSDQLDLRNLIVQLVNEQSTVFTAEQLEQVFSSVRDNLLTLEDLPF